MCVQYTEIADIGIVIWQFQKAINECDNWTWKQIRK